MFPWGLYDTLLEGKDTVGPSHPRQGEPPGCWRCTEHLGAPRMGGGRVELSSVLSLLFLARSENKPCSQVS